MSKPTASPLVLSFSHSRLTDADHWKERDVNARRHATSYSVPPSAARLTRSLRDVGYDLTTALADLVDNSITAGATEVCITFRSTPEAGHVMVADDGTGMSSARVLESLRFGSRQAYGEQDLGRFGLGLKTASLSLGRRLSVLSRTSHGRVVQRTLDLDRIEAFDEWLVVGTDQTDAVLQANSWFENRDSGTVIVIEELDRVLGSAPNAAAMSRRLENAAAKTCEHLAMVFHRYLAGYGGRPVRIAVESDRHQVELSPWDPFATDEPATEELDARTLPVTDSGREFHIPLRRFVLPARAEFSCAEQFERLSGPLKWNRQQGLYIYRAGRLVQYSGWARLRSIDEHTKLARASLDFPPALDSYFQINVSKMRINVPAEIRGMLKDPIQELCLRAAQRYRLSGERAQQKRSRPSSGNAAWRDVAFALRVAAAEVGELESMELILKAVDAVDPQLARNLSIGELKF